MAVLIGDKAHLWTDGRTSSIQIPPEKVSWTEHGFEYEAKGGVRVFGPGGGIYWMAAPSADAMPLQPMFDTPTTPPDGYKLNANMGRGDMYRVSLSGPDNRRARLGVSKEPPKASVWLVAKLPEGGKAAPALDRASGWKIGDDGAPLQQVPDGAVAVDAVEPSADSLAAWKADLSKLRGAPVAWTLKTSVDLDVDGKADGVVCVTGGKDDYSCYVAHTPGAATHYHGLNIDWDGKDAAGAPVLFTKGGAPYVMGVDSFDKGGGKLLKVSRFDGTAFITETIK